MDESIDRQTWPCQKCCEDLVWYEDETGQDRRWRHVDLVKFFARKDKHRSIPADVGPLPEGWYVHRDTGRHVRFYEHDSKHMKCHYRDAYGSFGWRLIKKHIIVRNYTREPANEAPENVGTDSHGAVDAEHPGMAGGVGEHDVSTGSVDGTGQTGPGGI